MRTAFSCPAAGLALVALSLAAPELEAQRAPALEASCFRGRPAPECGSFWITEAGYYRRLGGSEVDRNLGDVTIAAPALDSHLSWEVGGMVNHGPIEAFGGTLLVGVDNAGARLAVKARYRRWLGRSSTLDFSGGPARAVARVPDTGGARFHTRAYGVTGDIALGWGDWAAVTVRAEALRVGDRTVGAVYGGARLGSYPAVGVTVAGALYVALLVAALSGADF